ncbi:hypothetical protein K2173_025410 [Erythroxylum novogranatense]|uniref:Uncharacterized protein n=1 Tax=Erythroxylum novogranatense TaxID=1862640 RepID=A0AAV8UDV0_9ROSI|nr:hypothetical protein K2173_025410 [Erythroxylum novogranatense]
MLRRSNLVTPSTSPTRTLLTLAATIRITRLRGTTRTRRRSQRGERVQRRRRITHGKGERRRSWEGPGKVGRVLSAGQNRRRTKVKEGTSFKEPSAPVASVKNIPESHASYLMSGKELSKLVAFVKGTQFDLVEYLQFERDGSARLENYASGLELIGQKLQMDTLQSRLDAEFLLAHMCSVKFKEWIVVLSTLLRRLEVLFDPFRHDLHLWKAYSFTLQSHSTFPEYQDLVEDLEVRLSSVPELE